MIESTGIYDDFWIVLVLETGLRGTQCTQLNILTGFSNTAERRKERGKRLAARTVQCAERN